MDDIVLDARRALLIEAIETQHYRLAQEWDEDGPWYRMARKDGASVAIDDALYRLDEAIALLLDAEAEASLEEVSADEVGEQQPDGDGVLW